jgi:DNA-binding transcriptional LysR family regulator
VNLHQLRIFAAVAAEGSITGAGHRLHISQPAVSKQLAELEDTVGLPLLDRLPRGVVLTDAGRALQRHATAIFAAESSAETELAEMRGLSTGTVTMGASTTIGNYLLPPLLGAFDERYPGLTLDVDIQNTEHIQARVLGGELDFGLTEGLVTSDLLDVAVFVRDDIILIASPSSEYGRTRKLRRGALAKSRLILRERGSGTRAKVEESLADQGIDVVPLMSLGGTEAVKNAVAAGLGIAFVSRLAVEQELARTQLVEVKVPGLSIRRDLHLLTLKGKRLTASATAFVDMLRLQHRPPAKPR